MFKFCHNPPADYGRAVGRWGEMDLKLRAGFRGGCRRVQPVTKAKALGPLSVAVRCPLSDCTTGLCRSPCVVLYRTAQLAFVGPRALSSIGLHNWPLSVPCVVFYRAAQLAFVGPRALSSIGLHNWPLSLLSYSNSALHCPASALPHLTGLLLLLLSR